MKQLLVSVLIFAVTSSVPALAGPTTPVYMRTFNDAITADNEFVASDGKHYWTIDSGADSYQNEFYERPTVQGYYVRSLDGVEERFATDEYHANLDIVSGKAGFDDQFIYGLFQGIGTVAE